MELKNANPNSYNVVINNLHPTILFYFQKCWKLNETNDFKVYFRVVYFYNCPQTKLLITFDSLIKMEWFKAFHVYINLENQFQSFIFEKVIFLIYLDCVPDEKSNILGHNFWLVFPNVIKFCSYGRYSLYTTFVKIWAKNMHRYVPKVVLLLKLAGWSFRGFRG